MMALGEQALGPWPAASFSASHCEGPVHTQPAHLSASTQGQGPGTLEALFTLCRVLPGKKWVQALGIGSRPLGLVFLGN